MHIFDFLLWCGLLAACVMIGFVLLQFLIGTIGIIGLLLYGAITKAWKWVTNQKNS